MASKSPYIHRGYRRNVKAKQVLENYRNKSLDMKNKVDGLIDQIR